MSIKQNDTVELSLPLPKSLDTRIYIRLTTRAKAIVIFLTTASIDEMTAPTPMGSFVYALPNRFDRTQPLATTLFSVEPTIEFTTRMAKIVARKADMPAYVTNSISFKNAGMGGTVEEEMEAFRGIVDLVLPRIKDASLGDALAATSI